MAAAGTNPPMQGLGWPGIVRIGLAQASIGALVMLSTTVLILLSTKEKSDRVNHI